MPFAVVTGASKGIGRFIAHELAAKGYDLLLVARDMDQLGKVSQEIRVLHAVSIWCHSEDLAQPGAARRLFDFSKEKGFRVNMLVNNAGFGSGGFFPIRERHSDMIAVNISALTESCGFFLPLLKENAPSHILNIASTAAYQAVPMLSVYAATKAYVVSFSRGLRRELKDSGVKVTCVSPGPVDTDFANTAGLGGKSAQFAEKMNMKAEDVARQAVEATLAGKAESIPGFLNRISTFFVGILPKSWVEEMAFGLYQ
jgi:hypothetical protein